MSTTRRRLLLLPGEDALGVFSTLAFLFGLMGGFGFRIAMTFTFGASFLFFAAMPCVISFDVVHYYSQLSMIQGTSVILFSAW